MLDANLYENGPPTYSYCYYRLICCCGRVALGQRDQKVTGQTSPPVELSLEKRNQYDEQRVENVYWQHQILGQQTKKPRPSLEEVMPDAAIRAKAEDAVRRSLALETIWQRPLTPEQLQA